MTIDFNNIAAILTSNASDDEKRHAILKAAAGVVADIFVDLASDDPDWEYDPEALTMCVNFESASYC